MSEFLIYQTEGGKTQISVVLENETLWLSQKQLTELFGKAKGTISEHIKHIFEDGELTPAATVRLFRTVQTEGSRTVEREVGHYNLDMVLALGYRERSQGSVRFRQWAALRSPCRLNALRRAWPTDRFQKLFVATTHRTPNSSISFFCAGAGAMSVNRVCTTFRGAISIMAGRSNLLWSATSQTWRDCSTMARATMTSRMS
jgi:Virulence protein RhuM family